MRESGQQRRACHRAEVRLPQVSKHERSVHPPRTRYHAPWPIDEPDRLLGILTKYSPPVTSLLVSMFHPTRLPSPREVQAKDVAGLDEVVPVPKEILMKVFSWKLRGLSMNTM